MESISPHGYWLDTSDDGHFFDSNLAERLALLFKGSHVVDFGCGEGRYVEYLMYKKRIWCEGYDGNPNTKKMTFGNCKILDLAERVDLGCVFGWVLSLEVGEHIPAEYQSTFIDNIHRHNEKGVVLSWAIEGQPGRGHCNCRSNDYIKGLFAELGYKNDLATELDLRGHSTLPWFKNSLMVFRK